MASRNRFLQWPWLNLVSCIFAGFCCLVILLGSQPSSPFAHDHVVGAFSQWLVPIAMVIVCFIVPLCCVWIVRDFSNDRDGFLGLEGLLTF